MKTKLVIIALLLINLVNAQAQNEVVKHYEIDVLANFWTPSSSHMKASNSVTQVHIDNYYAQEGGISGYGTSIAPALKLTYYFNNTLGISLGFYPLIMDNELNVQKTDTSFSSYENQASIANFTLGIAGKIPSTSAMNIYYGAGINFIPNYDLEMKVKTESSNPRDLEASDVALGLYLNTGFNIKLNKFLSLKTGLEYSFIPRELEYNNGEGVTIYEKTNLGGVGLHTGLVFKF